MTDSDLALSIALGIGLAAATGFRVFLPMLVASAAAYSGNLPLGENFAWLATPAAVTLLGVAAVVGASLGLLAFDLRERLMLGDAGSNVIGAALGFGTVLTVSPPVRNGVLIALVVLNVLSEKVSFSRVIDRVGPLRIADRLGRKPV